MNNDLISREALKKAIDEAVCNFELSPVSANEIMQIIDNAPTVEQPTGKWELTEDEMFVFCPFCRKTDYTRPIDASWHFCPECGAELE